MSNSTEGEGPTRALTPTMTTIQTALDGLERDLKTFTEQTISQQEIRMKHIEHTLNKQLDMSLERPNVALTDEGRSLLSGAKAFDTYLRHGDQGMDTKALSVGDVPGSYLVPAPLQERLTPAPWTYPSLRSIARQITISGGSLEVILDRDLPTTGWVTEAQDRPLTHDGTLARIRIPVHELYAKQRATQKLLDDSAVNVEDWLVSRISDKMLRIENQAFIHGDGDAKPRGFLSYDLVAKADWTWGRLEALRTGRAGAFAEENASDVLIDLVETLPTEYVSGATWVMSRSAHGAIRKIRVPNTGAYLWQPAMGDKPYGTLLGYPVWVMDEMPALVPERPSASVVFGNFHEAYQIVDRGNLNVLRDPYSAKPYVEFYTTKRVGGDVVNFEAIKVLHFA